MASMLLQGEHDVSQLRSGYFLTMALVADIEVLAKQTHEIAVGKKYGAGAVSAHQRRFFTEMGGVAGNKGILGCFTDTGFTGKPVNATLSRAKVARTQKLVSGFYFFLQQPFFKSFDICGFKMFHLWVLFL
jgi:hypothetical protein